MIPKNKYWCFTQSSDLKDGKWITVDSYWYNYLTQEEREYIIGLEPEESPVKIQINPSCFRKLGKSVMVAEFMDKYLKDREKKLSKVFGKAGR